MKSKGKWNYSPMLSLLWKHVDVRGRLYDLYLWGNIVYSTIWIGIEWVQSQPRQGCKEKNCSTYKELNLLSRL